MAAPAFVATARAIIAKYDATEVQRTRARDDPGPDPSGQIRQDAPMPETPWLHQSDWKVRFEWGPAGVEAVPAEAVVVVDVLRFTTAVDAAVSRGAVVFPYQWKDDSAVEYAASVGAVLAHPGDAMGPSLSPVSLLSLGSGDRIVLPSPNGSTCAAIASAMGATVVAGCLRNASAIADWLNRRTTTVTVIACGERWPDGSLRPSIEDFFGAGAVIAALDGSRSPEAAAAADAWLAVAPRVHDAVSSCASGKEVVARGWGRDLEYAVSVDASTCVPMLQDGFIDANK
jgi:2-phosphosulfolactate phosphatase